MVIWLLGSVVIVAILIKALEHRMQL